MSKSRTEVHRRMQESKLGWAEALTPRRGTAAGAKATAPATQARPRTTVRMVKGLEMSVGSGFFKATFLAFICPLLPRRRISEVRRRI
jgi:hypothetical protein